MDLLCGGGERVNLRGRVMVGPDNDWFSKTVDLTNGNTNRWEINRGNIHDDGS